MALSAYQQACVNDGATYLWGLQETTGTNAADLADSNTGTYAGVTLAQAGLPGIGSAASFDGSTSSISTATSLAIPTNTFSWELWLNTATAVGASNAGGLLQFDSLQTPTAGGQSQNLLVYLGTDNKLYFAVWTGSAVSLVSANTMTDGAWHHAVGKMAANGNMSLYVDGVRIVSNSNTGSVQAMAGFWDIGWVIANTWTNLTGSGGQGIDRFNGLLSEVMIYSATALSDAQVLNHYNLGLGGGASQFPHRAPRA